MLACHYLYHSVGWLESSYVKYKILRSETLLRHSSNIRLRAKGPVKRW
jgi:hypothetical protein